MPNSYTFNRKAAVENILNRLEVATEVASAQGADRAREAAPLGKGERAATGANPRFFSVRLQTVRSFTKANKRKGGFTQNVARLSELRSLNRAELAQEVRPEDVKFFRYSSGSRKGETPDELDVRPARGPGGEVVKGATTHYTPGRLKKGIHPLAVERSGTTVKGGWASEAPYSNLVEKGFHHKGGTQVAPVGFMEQATETLREEWNSGKLLKE